MIWLSSDYLLFQMPSGESVAFSSEAIAVEIVDEIEGELDANMVKQAANAVYHYFQHELGRHTVTVSEFSKAMEKALEGFEISIVSTTQQSRTPVNVAKSDLCRIARDSGRAFELTFFPKLRDELKMQLLGAPQVVRFTGLRSCVKELTGARRWSARCTAMEEQIVGYVRECLNIDAARAGCMLVVE